MARIPESVLERLKVEVSLVRLIEGAGHVLKAQGKDLAMRRNRDTHNSKPNKTGTPTIRPHNSPGCLTRLARPADDGSVAGSGSTFVV
jgi:hypothetical protein